MPVTRQSEYPTIKKRSRKTTIKQLEKMGFQPGDILLIKSKRKHSSANWKSFIDKMKKVLALAGKSYVPIAILQGDLDVQILRIPPKEVINNDRNPNEGGPPKNNKTN